MTRFPRIAKALLPSGERWPDAVTALGAAQWCLDESAEVEALEAELAGAADAAAPVSAFARRHPARFAALCGALYTAYYSTAPVRAVIDALAEQGQGEGEETVDPRLVETVVREHRGRRRL